ncbi:MAG TPA: nicotinate phosphoribosyltransferase [Nitrospiria bacterium]
MRPASEALLTDLYQLTMLQGYFDSGMEDTAVFEFFMRKLPPGRNFLMAAGLEEALDYLEHLYFDPEDILWLKSTKRFKPAFLDHLADLRFTGDVHAMPEGTLFFPNEPILRVTAPLPEAQLVETRLINLLHFETLIASKAARIRLAAPGKKLIDFGLRRAHGSEAGVLAARASYIAGMDGTSNVLAGRRFGIPTFGTMAHSFIQAHEDETGAFINFARSQPENVVLLLDTYDVKAAAEKIPALAADLGKEGIRIKGVRLDSGDIAGQSRMVRRILDAANLNAIQILASGNLDEDGISRMVNEDAPIDSFGVGTHLTTASDAPSLDCAYKLQEYAGKARRKRSEGKETWPGRKQVYRRFDGSGRMTGDLLTLETDRGEGSPLLDPVMKKGRRIKPAGDLEEIRQRASEEMDRLPVELRSLQGADPYPVTLSESLRALAREVDGAR